MKIKFDLKNIPKDILRNVLMGIAILALFLGFIWRPRHHEVISLNTRLAELNEKMEFITAQVKHPEALNNEILRMQYEFNQLERMLPDYGRLPMILSTLSQEASRRKIKVVSSRPGEIETPAGEEAVLRIGNKVCQKLEIQLELIARYKQLGEYLVALRNIPGVVVVKEMNISKKSETSSLVQAELLLEAHLLE